MGAEINEAPGWDPAWTGVSWKRAQYVAFYPTPLVPTQQPQVAANGTNSTKVQVTYRHLISYLRGAAGLSPLVDTAAKTDDADSDPPATIVSRTLVFPQGYLGFDCYKPPSLLQIPGTELLLAFANGRRTTSDAAADNIVMRQSTDAGV